MIRCLFLSLFLIACAQSVKVEKTATGLAIGVVNLQIEGNHSMTSLLLKMEKYISSASAKSAKAILFPELVTFDLLPKKPDDKKIPELLNNLAAKKTQYENGLSLLAKKYNMMIVGANHYIRKDESLINRAYIVMPDGEIQSQDKIYPTPWERKQNVAGGKETRIFETEDFSFVVLTCHDAEFPDLSMKVAKLKPEVIFVPSMTDDLNGLQRVKRTSQARAVEHMSYVAMTGTSSLRGASWHTYQGKPFLFTPQNKYFKEPDGGKLEPELKIFYLNIPHLREARADKRQVYPVRDILNLGN